MVLYCVMKGKIELGKWWRTPSAQAAMRRVEAQRKVRAKNVREYFATRRAAHTAEIAALDREIWKGVKQQ